MTDPPVAPYVVKFCGVDCVLESWQHERCVLPIYKVPSMFGIGCYTTAIGHEHAPIAIGPPIGTMIDSDDITLHLLAPLSFEIDFDSKHQVDGFDGLFIIVAAEQTEKHIRLKLLGSGGPIGDVWFDSKESE